jgi:polysaccharide biosynthesis protein PslH
MKILQLCKKFPFPLKDGEAIAVNTLAKSLKELGAEMTLLTMNTSKHRVDENDLPDSFSTIYENIYAVDVYNHITITGACWNFFQKESYHVTRFVSKAYEAKLIEILETQDFDVIQLETVYLTPYIPTIRKYAPKAVIALRAHNVEHEIWKRVAEVTKIAPKRWYLNYLNHKLRRFELENISKCDVLLPITARDLRIFKLLGYRGKAVVTPVGLKSQDYRGNWKVFNSPPSIGFIGSLDWMPNQEGLRWFLENVWADNAHKDTASKYPYGEEWKNLKFHIAGRNAPTNIKNLKAQNVTFHGEVADAKAFMNDHSLAVVPLFSGSGIRVKILEAMMLGRVVVTTSMGLEGINAKDGEEVLIANNAYEFAEKIDRCLKKPEILRGIGERARAFAMLHFDNLEIAEGVLKAYTSLVPKEKVELTNNNL